MRILLTCPYDWDAPGGVQVHVAQLAERLLSRGHAVRVLTPAGSTPHQPWARAVAPPIRIAYAGTVAPVAPNPWSARGIRREMDSFEPDVVHVHEPLTPSTSMYATLVSRVPVVATFHAYLERSRLLAAARPILGPVWRRIDSAVAVSEAAASFSVRRFGGEPLIIPNGVEVGAFATGVRHPAAPEGRVLLWVNRLDPQKGFATAVRAFQRIARTHPDLWFVVAGDGADRAEVDALPADARSRVRMLGRVEHADLPAWFAAADVFVSPAMGQESFGIVLVEAMASGVPVVATDIPGYREVVRDGTDGLLVAPGDEAGLAAAVVRVLDDPDLAASLGAAGRSRAEDYSWGVVVPRLEQVYTAAVSGDSVPG